jgi:hypothetical protein
MWAVLSNGRTPGLPPGGFRAFSGRRRPNAHASKLSRLGIHWDELDEDTSVAGLLAKRGDITNRPERLD